jgi:Flp pilus assembly protein TadD
MNRIVVIALGCLLAVACAGAQEEAPDPSMLHDERADPYAFNLSVAHSLLDTQQPMEASRVARRLIAMQPDDVEPYYLLARAHMDMRQFESAEKMLREVLRREPEHAQAHSLYGTLFDLRGQHRMAVVRHRRAIVLEPENASFRNNLGFSLYLQGNYRGAITAFQRALERDNSLRRVHNNLGFAHGKLGDLAKAAEQFALAGPPAQVSNNLGVLQEERGELEAAYTYYLTAAQIDPLLVPARANLQRVCTALGRELPELPDPDRAQARASVEPVDAVYIEAESAQPRAPAAAPAVTSPITPVEVKP